MYVSKEILNLVPYSPGKPVEETQREYGLEQVYKLASNENPLGVGAKVKEALMRAINDVNRYPDASFYEMKSILAKYYAVKEDRLTFGNGSNELIDLLIRIYCEPGDSILTSEHAFIAYKLCAQGARVATKEVPMGKDLRFNLEEISKQIEESNKVRLVFIANPNNPTGTYVTESEIEQLLAQHKDNENILFILDEAYNEFVREKDYPDSLKLIKKYNNLVVMRTLSKVYGLAGLRVGALIAPPEVIDLVNRVRNPFNVNSLAQVAAIAAVSDQDYLKASQKVIWEGLDFFMEEFSKMGVKYWPSQANFILFDCGRPGAEVFQELLKKGVIMRPVTGYGLPHCLRLSVGVPEENQRAIKALAEVL